MRLCKSIDPSIFLVYKEQYFHFLHFFKNSVKTIPNSQLQIWLSFLFNKCWNLKFKIIKLWWCFTECCSLNSFTIPGRKYLKQRFHTIWKNFVLGSCWLLISKLLKLEMMPINSCPNITIKMKYIFQPPYFILKKKIISD